MVDIDDDGDLDIIGYGLGGSNNRRQVKVYRNDLPKKKDRERVEVLGLIEDVRRIRTKKGDAMAFVTLQDETSVAWVTLFPKENSQYNKMRDKDALIENK